MSENNSVYSALFIYTLIVYAIGMVCIPMMEVDAAQYASISEQMLREGGYLQIRYMQSDYLDKPPLLFWLSALSMHLFQYNTFSYKLPSVLATCLAVYSTFKYTRLFYSFEIARAAALLGASCQAFFIISNDCRTDNLLIGFCCYAIWKIASYLQKGQDIDLYTGFIGIGLAMLSKGPLGLVFPFFTISSILVGNKYYSKINWKWLWGIPIIGILLTPMCIGLYRQFGFKGLEFYFWTQSFGRITGQSEWANDSTPLFFVHTFLWCFLPFSLLFILALGNKINATYFKKNITRDKLQDGTIWGFALTFIALSLSRYKLPHYIYILCPLASVLTVEYLLGHIHSNKLFKKVLTIQSILLILMTVFVGWVAYLFSTTPYPFLFIVSIIFIITLFGWWKMNRGSVVSKIIVYSVLTAVSANLVLNTLFYPNLLKYQSSSEAAFYILKQKIPADQVMAYKIYGHGLSYYLHQGIPFETEPGHIPKDKNHSYVYTNESGLNDFKSANLPFSIIKTFDDFHVSGLNYKFLNPATRKSAVTSAYLVKFE